MIADSSAWIEFLRGRRSTAARRLEAALRQGQTVLMPDVVLQEVLQGARDPRARLGHNPPWPDLNP
jgi:predicted nucleic acid-binding protein